MIFVERHRRPDPRGNSLEIGPEPSARSLHAYVGQTPCACLANSFPCSDLQLRFFDRFIRTSHLQDNRIFTITAENQSEGSPIVGAAGQNATTMYESIEGQRYYIFSDRLAEACT